MQFLQEIIGLSYIHFYPDIDQFSPQGAKNQRLYQAIRDGEVTTDQEASQLIYGDRQAGKKYTMLKQRLKQQVTSNYFEQLSRADNDVYSSDLRHRFDYLKQLTIIHTLMQQGRYTLARQLLHYQQKAAAAQFDLSTVHAGLELLRQMASYQGDRTAFRRYDTQLGKSVRQATALHEIRGYYETVRIEHRRRLAPSASIAKSAQEFIDTLQRQPQADRHPVVTFYARLVKLLMVFHQGDLKRFRRILFFQKEHMKRYPALITLVPVAQADLLAMEYLATLRPEDQSLVVQHTVQGSRDESLPAAAWLGLREIECIHWLRTGDYQRAQQLCQQLETEAEAETYLLATDDQARWAFFLAYACYMIRNAADEIADRSLAADETAVQPLLSDAAGYGWQWFVFKMLRWLERPFLPASHFLRQIDTYARRHLADQTARSVQFFRQLRVRVAYQNKRKKKTELPTHVNLPTPTDCDLLQELIPYEILWQAMVDRETTPISPE